MNTIDIFSIVTVAFLGSVGHCIGMCGGIVIAYSSTKVDEKWSKLIQSVAHLTYSLGRITTYTLLGAIFGAIGGVASFNNIANAALTIVAGVFMILAGLSLIGKLQFLTKLEHSFSGSRWYQEVFRNVLRSKSLYSFFILGLLNGLLPCGLVYFFAVTAASTGSPLWGALVMFIFGLSTVPALFTLGLFTGIFTKSSLRKTMMNLAAMVVVLYGLYTVYRGYDFIIHPEKSLLNCCDTDQEIKGGESQFPKFEGEKIEIEK
ncbi:MAG: sulfite exporter TauE/SafE family protein [Campylobacterota bacterium]|nr:sulfite exporter TauE/SafE family protein [Campylobacterota bacterium]